VLQLDNYQNAEKRRDDARGAPPPMQSRSIEIPPEDVKAKRQVMGDVEDCIGALLRRSALIAATKTSW
jgi:hypothetical protein